MSRLNDALTLASQGFYIFPLHNPLNTGGCSCGDPDCDSIGKHPRITGWQDKATTAPEQIRQWWQKWPAANIGLAVGKSGLLVIDIDPRHGGSVELLPLAPAELETVTQVTGGGGLHLIYRQPQGVKFGNSDNELAEGINVRGDGGLVVGPGSLHASGTFYEWQPGRSPADLPPLPLPFALGQLLKPKGGETPQARPVVLPAPSNGSVKPYVRAAFEDELAILAAAPVGDRNIQLNTSTFNVAQLVGAGLLDESEVETAFTRQALAIGLTERETTKTIQSAMKAGKAQPRQIPPPVSPSRPASNDGGRAPAETEQETAAQLNRLTDLGNARRMVGLYGQDIRFVPAWGKWFAWDGTRWANDETGAVMRLAKRVPLAIYQEALAASEENRPKFMKWGATTESHGRLEAMIKLTETEPGIPVKHRTLDSNPFLLNCKNGTIDLATGRLLEHNRDDLITKRLDIEYHADAQCPLWLAFLDRIFASNQELIAYIQRAVGYTLTGDIGEQCLFFMYGTGSNGKSVFSETIRALLGEYGQKAPVEMLMAKFSTGGATNDVARLAGARFVVVSEVEEGRRLAESLVKDLTGGDTVAARFLYQDTFEFEPTHKLWMYGNHKPEIRGTDNGIWRRMRLIPFTVTIPPEEQDEQLTQKLRGELPGILAWAVQGCLEWQRIRLKTPAVVTSATDSYRAEMDVLSEFLDECCVAYMAAKVKANILHQAYLEWCKESNEPRPLSRRAFGNRLRERGYVSDDSSNYVFWLGLGLKSLPKGAQGLE